jgi:hypothetical protein
MLAVFCSFAPSQRPLMRKTIRFYRTDRTDLAAGFCRQLSTNGLLRTCVGLTELSAYFFTFHTFFKNYLAIARNQDGQYGFGASRSFSVAKSPYSCLIKSVRLVRSVRQSVRSQASQ